VKKTRQIKKVSLRSDSIGTEKALSRQPIGFRILEKRYRLETVVAHLAMPEIGNAARAVFDPVGRCDRRTALGAGIPAGQIADIYFGHGASPLLFISISVEHEWDRFAAGLACTALSPTIFDAPVLDAPMSLLNGRPAGLLCRSAL
jgi:hypothetical protein